MRPILTVGLLITASLFFMCAPTAPPRSVKHESDSIRQGMAAIADELHECYERFQVGGHVQARMTIEADGQVSSVELDDTFAGTPTGKCVREVLLTKARFKPEQRSTIIRYPVLLR